MDTTIMIDVPETIEQPELRLLRPAVPYLYQLCAVRYCWTDLGEVTLVGSVSPS